MVRSFHRLFVAKDDAEYRALLDFFESLGLAKGEGWDGKRSKGVKLEAFESGIELGMGEGFPDADLVIEVDNADIVADLARRKNYKFAQEVEDADWGARMFVLELPANAGRLAVFSYTENWRQKEIAGPLDAHGMRFAVVVSRFNAFITERLLTAAVDALVRLGAAKQEVHVVRVPGAFEIPTAARILAETGNYDALVTVGCLLRGDTAHYDVIVNEVTRGIGQASQETGIPMGFGVLTCDTLEQAIDRSGLKAGNKGFEAAMAAVEMASLKKAVKAGK